MDFILPSRLESKTIHMSEMKGVDMSDEALPGDIIVLSLAQDGIATTMQLNVTEINKNGSVSGDLYFGSETSLEVTILGSNDPVSSILSIGQLITGTIPEIHYKISEQELHSIVEYINKFNALPHEDLVFGDRLLEVIRDSSDIDELFNHEIFQKVFSNAIFNTGLLIDFQIWRESPQ